MASAFDLVGNPELDISPITTRTASAKGYTNDELAHFRIGHDDIQKLALTVYDFGRLSTDVKTDIRRFVQDAVFEDSIDKTPTFTLTIHDPDWDLLNSGALDHTIDINPGRIPRRWYRLDSVEVNDDDISLIFSTRNAVYLTYHKKPRKANRKKITRAMFILVLLRTVKKTRIPFYCPQLKKRQKVAKTRFASDRERDDNRDKGFTDSDKITVKGGEATKSQKRVIEKVIQAGVDTGMPGLLIVAAVMCVIKESTASENPQPGNPPYVGAFQQNRGDGWPGTGDAYKDARGDGSTGRKSGGFYGWALPIYKKHPNMDLGQLVATSQGVVGSTNPLNAGYAQDTNRWRSEAQHAANAFSGLDIDDPGSQPTDVEFKEKFEFMVGEPDGKRNENYLAAIYRLAEQVNWRAYWVRDVLHFMSEDDLFTAKARTRLRRFEDGVESVSFGWDRGKPVNQMTLQVRMERWVCPIGTVVVFDEGGPAQGRWLVTNLRRSMFNELGQITLSKPMKERLEPANAPGSRSGDPRNNQDTGFGGGDSVLGGLADVKETWTPKQIIDRIVVPKAKYYGMNTGITPEMVEAQNAAHGTNVSGSTNVSDHKGPPSIAWADDMSNDIRPSDEMDNLASDLIMSFELPSLAVPLAQPLDGEVPGNLVNAVHKGFRFQLIYRTNLSVGGNHYNHVHFGVKRVSAIPMPGRPGGGLPTP